MSGEGTNGAATGDSGAALAPSAATMTAAKRVAIDPAPDAFRVIVAIRECRELVGSGDAVELNPFVRVNVASQMKVTKTMSKTADPNFDEVFNFDFPSIPPAALFEQVILLEVFDSGWVSNSEIGSFKFDAGNVYSQPGHQYANQWVELNHRTRSDGATGYMQVTVTVIGQGERAPVVQDNDPDPENFAQDPRVLRLNKATGAPHKMTIRIFAAEDLPQMDARQLRVIQSGLSRVAGFFSTGEDDEYEKVRPYKAGDCDPYVKCTFGGVSQTTETVSNTQFPTFKEHSTLEFTVDLPSTVTTLKVEAFDSDAGLIGNSDDIIGTARINVAAISNGGKNGYGPTFGPAFVNLWGPTREMTWEPTALQGEYIAHMYKGLVEGCDYRGRVLMEISTGKAAGKSALKDPLDVLRDVKQTQIPYECRVEVLSVTMINSDYGTQRDIAVEAHMNPTGWDEAYSVSERMEPERIGGDDAPYFLNIRDEPIVLGVPLEASRDAEGDYWAYNVKRHLTKNLEEEINKCLDTGPIIEHERALMCLKEVASLVRAEADEIRDNPPKMPSTQLGKKMLTRWKDTLCAASDELEYHLAIAQEERQRRKNGGDKSNSKNNRNGAKGNKSKKDERDTKKRKRNGGSDSHSELSERPKTRSPLIGIVLVERLKAIAATLKTLVVRPVHEHTPDLVVRIVSGGEVFGYVRIRPEDIVHSNDEAERGPLCDRAVSYVLRPLEEVPKTSSEIPALIQLRAVFGAREGTTDWVQPRRTTNGSEYQLRCYIYQAEGLLSADEGDESDVYFRVTCGKRSGRTVVVPDQNDPQHNFTVILDDVFVPDGVATDSFPDGEAAPEIVVEAFDHDDGVIFDSSDFLGRAHFTPKVRQVGDDPVKLEYHDVFWQGQKFGRILMAAELIANEDIDEIPIDTVSCEVPSDIAPETTRYRVFLRPLGLRNLKPVSMFFADRPHVKIEIAGADSAVETSKVVSMARHPNFEVEPLEEGQHGNASGSMGPRDGSVIPPGNIEMGAYLPIAEHADLAPRMTFKVLETRPFGSVEIIGHGSIDLREQVRLAGLRGNVLKSRNSHGGKKGNGRNNNRNNNSNNNGGRSKGAGTSLACPGKEMDPTKRLPCRHEDHLGRTQLPCDPSEMLMTELVRYRRHYVPDFKSGDGRSDPAGRLYDEKQQPKKPRKKHDWWSKFLCSSADMDDHEPHHDGMLLRHFERELESVYPDMSTMIGTHPIMRGNEVDDEAEVVGQFVMGMAIFPDTVENVTPEMLPWSSKNLDRPVPVLIRVYVVRALELRSTDEDGLFGGTSASDPYIRVKLGSRSQDNRSEYVQNTNDPDFGRMFELEATLPKDSTLRVQVMDHDAGGAVFGNDDMIGETVIDLETRFLSERHASCGICECHPEWTKYWRDSKYPFELLCEWAAFHAIPRPYWNGKERVLTLAATGNEVTEITVTSKDVPWEWDPNAPERDDAESKDRYLMESFALHAIHQYTNLMPEHVERRALFSSARGAMVQGYVDLWVDIFEVPSGDSLSTGKKGESPPMIAPPGAPGTLVPARKKQNGAGKAVKIPKTLPPPVEFPPRKPIEFELRMIVHRARDVIADETSFVSGQKMSDIFVRAFVLDHANRPHQVQNTDTHFRSLNGEGLFNWRMKFNIRYHTAKKRFVWEDGGVLAKMAGTAETRTGPPVIVIQIWDADTFSADDFLGYARIDLTKLRTAKTEEMKKKGKVTPQTVNIFDRHGAPNAPSPVVKTWVRCHGKYDATKLADPPGCCKRFFCRCDCLCCKDMSRYDSDTDDDFMGEEKPLPWESTADAEKRKSERDKRVDSSSQNRTGKAPKRMMTGRVEVELELVSTKEAEENPVGIARDPPHPMPEPNRPKDSFYPLTSPAKSIWYAIILPHKWKILFLLLLTLVVILAYYFITTFPEIAAQRLSDWICFTDGCKETVTSTVNTVASTAARNAAGGAGQHANSAISGGNNQHG